VLKIGFDEKFVRGHYGRGMLVFAGVSGMLTTILGIALAFFPAQQITSLLSYEIWMLAGRLASSDWRRFFFFVYGSRKAARKLAEARRPREIGSWRKVMSSPAKPAVKTYQNYVNGQWVSSSTGETFPVFDPSTEEVIANVSSATASDVDKA